MLLKPLALSHQLMAQSLNSGETALDGTCGKGKDTIVLSRIVGESGRVIAVDIQEQAIQLTAERLQKEKVENVSLLQANHRYISGYLARELQGKLGGALFNLGYLPGSDKQIITKPENTIKAINGILPFLKQKGLLVLVVYPGHPGGTDEKEALLAYLGHLNQENFNVLRYEFMNQKNNPPFLLAVEKEA